MQYLTTLNTRPFLYFETKKIAELLNQGDSIEEMRSKVINGNIFQLVSPDRSERFFNEIMKRLDFLDEYMLKQFVSSDIDTAKAILLYAILKKDALFYEWMRDIIFEKICIMDFYISKKETDHFFEIKSEQSETVRNWSEKSKIKLRNNYHSVLREAGTLKNISNSTNERISPIIVNPEVRAYLIGKKEKNIAEIALGEP